MRVRERWSRIPDAVMYDERVSAGAKLLYIDMANLSSNTGTCWALRSELADKHHVNVRTLRRWITELENFGYVSKNINSSINVVPLSKISRMLRSEENRTKMSDKSMSKMSVGVAKTSAQADKNVNPSGQKCPPERTKMSNNKRTIKRTIKRMIKRTIIKSKISVLRTAYFVNKVDSFVKMFNSRAGKNKIVRITRERRLKLINIMLKYTDNQIHKAVNNFFDSDFLQGYNHTGWCATVDWLLDETHFLRVLENAYGSTAKSSENKESSAMKPTEDVEEIEQLFAAMYKSGKDDDHV